jgi:hypothetical protein
VGERLSCVFGGEMGWRGGEYVRGGDKFGCDGCGDWNVAVLQGPAATAARWFAMTDGVVPGVMRGGRVYEAEVPGPGPDIVAEREYPDEKELGLPSSRRGDWARMSGQSTKTSNSVRKLEEKFWTCTEVNAIVRRELRRSSQDYY